MADFRNYGAMGISANEWRRLHAHTAQREYEEDQIRLENYKKARQQQSDREIAELKAELKKVEQKLKKANAKLVKK